MSRRYKAKCEHCCFSKTVTDYFRSYFVSGAATVNVRTSFGYCSDCDDIMQIEVVPDLEDLLNERKLVADRDAIVVQRFEEQRRGSTQSLDEYLGRQLHDLDERIRWRKDRVSPPRCLECSSISITPFVAGQTNSGNPRWEGKCPKCGESIRVFREPALVLTRLWGRYSPEGVHLKQDAP